jgi:transposase
LITVWKANVGKNIVAILDNFPSHKAEMPSYSPDLNPIEFIWKSIKRDISCEFIQDVDHLKQLILEKFYKYSAHLSFASNWIEVFLEDKLSIIC